MVPAVDQKNVNQSINQTDSKKALLLRFIYLDASQIIWSNINLLLQSKQFWGCQSHKTGWKEISPNIILKQAKIWKA